MKAIDSLFIDFRHHPLNNTLVTSIGRAVYGWQKELREGELFKPWNSVDPVHACLYVQDVERLVFRGRMYQLSMLSRSGPSVGMEFYVRMHGAEIQQVIRNCGHTMYARHDDYEIAGLCLTAQLHRKRQYLALRDVTVSSSQLTFNKRLREGRSGRCTGLFEPFAKGKCAVCPLSRQRCPLSRFDKGYEVFRTCANEHKGWFRNEDAEYCLACMTIGKFKIEQKNS